MSTKKKQTVLRGRATGKAKEVAEGPKRQPGSAQAREAELRAASAAAIAAAVAVHVDDAGKAHERPRDYRVMYAELRERHFVIVREAGKLRRENRRLQAVLVAVGEALVLAQAPECATDIPF